MLRTEEYVSRPAFTLKVHNLLLEEEEKREEYDLSFVNSPAIDLMASVNVI